MKLSIGLGFYLVFELFCHTTMSAQDQNLIKRSLIAENNKHRAIQFGIMLPSSYDNNNTYPVLYYLHGLNGFYADWKAQNVAEFFTTHSLNSELPECILVFPDGGEGFWCDHYDQDPLLEKEIVEFLIPFVDENYSVDTTKRLIMGWSVGGFGAMNLFSQHPELFKAAISLDGPMTSWEEFIALQGVRPRIVNNSDYFYENASPNRSIVRNSNAIKEKQDTTIFLAAAFLVKYHQNLLSILEGQEIPYKYIELSCPHEFGCVFSEISDDLVFFLSKALK
ncbi:alpha/beta hydrolase [Carboxylicivirga taeanensis]|uniref:alpha/beta hydrolase n=1 Tax=Carboxylicivirga taeanensis TaxID=1416875 RepID=UPI003F6E0CBF